MLDPKIKDRSESGKPSSFGILLWDATYSAGNWLCSSRNCIVELDCSDVVKISDNSNH